jgi:hypothetical protein
MIVIILNMMALSGLSQLSPELRAQMLGPIAQATPSGANCNRAPVEIG